MRKLCHEALKVHYRYDSLWGGLKVLQGQPLSPKTGLRVPCSAFVVQKQALIVYTNCKADAYYRGVKCVSGKLLSNCARDRLTEWHSWRSWRAASLPRFPHFKWSTWCLLCVCIFFFLCLRTCLFAHLAMYTFKGIYTHLYTHHPSNTNTEGS